jgi:hypothetical protein
METKASKSFVFNILTLHAVVLCVLIETGSLCFTHWTNKEALIVLTKGFPDDGTTGVPKHVGRKTCISFFPFLVQEELVRQIYYDTMHGTCNMKFTIRHCRLHAR